MGRSAEKALENHKKGYNCAQAVACAFCEQMDKNEQDVFEIMEPFGFGMGYMGTCGAVSAMAAVVGMAVSDGQLDNPGSKKECYSIMKELVERFKDKNGSVICREIKGVDTGNVLRSCDGCVIDAAELLEEFFAEHQDDIK